MAYNDIHNAVTSLSERLGDEENFLGVEEQVLHLHTELLKMKNFLKNSKGNSGQHNHVIVLVDKNKITDIARKVANIVDTYAIKVAKERRRNSPMKYFCSFNRVTMLHSVQKQIKQLKTITKEINENRGSYHIQPNDAIEEEELERHDLLQRRRKGVEEIDAVGLVEEAETVVVLVQEAETLVNQLVKDNYAIQQNGANEDEELQLDDLLQNRMEVEQVVVNSIVEDAETLANQQVNDKSEIQENIINVDEELQMNDLVQTHRMEVEGDDFVYFVEEAEALVNQLVKDESEILQDGANGYEELQMHVLPQKCMMEVDQDDVIGFVKEPETLVNQLVKNKFEIQHNSTNEDEELHAMHDLPLKRTMGVEEDDVVGFVRETETLANQIQQNDINKDEELQMRDLLQKHKMEVKEKDVVGFFMELETLANQPVKDNSEIQPNDINADEELKMQYLPQKCRMEVKEEDVVGIVKDEETLGNQQVKGKSKIQQNIANEDEELQMNDPLQTHGMEVEEDDAVFFVEEVETSENQLVKDKSEIQQNNLNECIKLHMHDSSHKCMMELDEDYVVGFVEEPETLGNRLIKDKSEIGQNGINEELQMHDLLPNHNVEVEEDDIVGFIEEAKTLVNQLVEGTEELDVISISGMGGLGKTRLTQKVYNDLIGKDHFERHASVNVSQHFKLKELLLEILNQVPLITTDEISDLRVEELKQVLKNQLSHHRYLVVLDDIWKRQLWDELKNVFPNDKNGSRVLVTTRIAYVARHASGGKDPLNLRFLNDDESMELFTKKVFRGGNYPTDSESLLKDKVAKCGGLPLAVLGLGELLESKDTHEAADPSIHWDTKYLNILAPSYHNLPPYLQPCFLYLGLFPEDYKIPARQLIQLWISEGFIEHEDNITTRKEDVAENYMLELIDRSLIQVEERRSNGGVKTCRVHNLTRDLCLQLSMEEGFLESHYSVYAGQAKPQRLSIHCSRRDYISGAKSSNTCFVRTLLCFNPDNRDLSQKHWKSLFKSFKLIRVLDLGEGEVHKLPTSIDNLILLKYLRVQIANNARVPSTICALNSLQTLDLRSLPSSTYALNNRTNVLPEEIWGMQQLRHLYLNEPSKLPKNAGTRCLYNLQTLCYVCNGRVHIAEKAPNLRKLGLYDYWCDSSDEQDFTFDLPYLESLKFVKECAFKKPIKLPSTITRISIKSAELKPGTMETFQNLLKLRKLKLDEVAFHNDELVFEQDWFPALQLLKIKNSSIKSWKRGKGAAPKLKRVVINKCPELRNLPEELLDMITLQDQLQTDVAPPQLCEGNRQIQETK